MKIINHIWKYVTNPDYRLKVYLKRLNKKHKKLINKREYMKKIILTLTMIVASTVTIGQGLFKDSKFFIDFGPKVSVGPSWFSNGVSTPYNTTENQPYLHKLNSIRLNIGGKFAFDFNDNFAIVVEYLHSKNTQRYEVDSNNLEIKSIGSEIPLMLRFNKENDTYVEGGIVFSNTKSVTETLNGVMTDYTNLYNTKRTGFVFGVGGYAFGVGNWGVSTGFRLRYNPDMVANSDKVPGGNVYAMDNRIDVTNDVSIMLVLEFNYDLGFTMAKSACGRSRKFMFQAR